MTSAGKTMDEDSTISLIDIRSEGIFDADIPAWIIPLLNKYKTEICAEVTARVAYSVRLMLDKQLDEMKAAIFQQTNKFEEAANAAVLEELESEKERKRQMKDQNKGKRERKRETASKSSKPERSSTTWTFLKQEGIIKTNGAEGTDKRAKLEERKREKEEKKKLKKERKHKLKELAPKRASLSEDGQAAISIVNEQVARTEETVHKREDATVTNQLFETAVESLKDTVTQPVIPGTAEILKEEREPDTVNTEASTTEAEANGLIPQLQLQSPGPATQSDTLQLVHMTEDGPSVENDILPSFVVCEEPAGAKTRERWASSGSEFEVVPMSAAISSTQHSYSSAETCVFPPCSDEDTDLDDYYHVNKQHLDDFESLPGRVEDIVTAGAEDRWPAPQASAELEAKRTEQIVVPEEAGPSPSLPESSAVGTANHSYEHNGGEMDEASGEASGEGDSEESASPRTPREKVFTEDFFQQVDAFEKKTQTHKTVKDSVVFVPPAEKTGILSPTKVLQPTPVEPAPFQEAPQSSKALEEALLNIPYVGEDQQPVAENAASPRHYPVDVPAETLWEGALTRAAQAYNTARTAVDDISDTFSHVRQRSRMIPRRNLRLGLETARKEQSLMQLEEMGFHNQHLNVKLLEQHNYDLEIVITALVELQNGW